VRRWQNQDTRAILDRPVLRVAAQIRRREDGLEREFLVLSAPDWVNIIPVTSQGRVVLIRQWRHGVCQTALEIPGGMVDPGETPAQAAARELLEETGHRAGSLEDLGWVHPNPALFDNRCHTFLARDCQRVQAQRTEDDEEIEVLEVAAGELPGLVAGGGISHSLVVAALCKWWLAAGGCPPANKGI